MSLDVVAFTVLAAVTLGGAVGATVLRDLSHALLTLVMSFVGVAGFFFWLGADFLGVVQILVYVGAVAVLIVFAIVLTRGAEQGTDMARIGGAWGVGAVSAALVGGVLVYSLRVYSNGPLADRAAAYGNGTAATDGISKPLGEALMTTWVLPFELASILLTAALVGAIALAIESKPHGALTRRDAGAPR